MNENWISEFEVRDASRRLEMLCQKIQYRLDKENLYAMTHAELQEKYQRFIGVREFLDALKRHDLEDYLRKNEVFTLNLINLSEDES